MAEKFKPKQESADELAKKGAKQRREAFKKTEQERKDKSGQLHRRESNTSSEIERLQAELAKVRNEKERNEVYARLAQLVREKKKIINDLKKERTLVSSGTVSAADKLSPEELKDRYREIYQEGGNEKVYSDKVVDAGEYYAGQVGAGHYEYRKTPTEGKSEAEVSGMEENNTKIREEMKALKKRAKELEKEGRYPEGDEEGKPSRPDVPPATPEPAVAVGVSETMPSGDKAEKPGMMTLEQREKKGEELRLAVENARSRFTEKDYESVKTLDRLRKFFGMKMKTKEGDLSDTHVLYEEYRKVLNDYLIFKVEDLKNKYQNMPPEEMNQRKDEMKKEMGGLVKEFNLDEKLNLYNARTEAMIKSREGTITGRILEFGKKQLDKYRKLGWKKQLLISAALMAGGALAVSAGSVFAVGAVGSAGFLRRMAGSASAGYGMTLMQESARRALDRRSSRKDIGKSLEDMDQENDLDRKFDILMGKLQSEVDTYKASYERERRKVDSRRIVGGATALGTFFLPEIAKKYLWGHTPSPYETAGAEFDRPIDANNPYETAGAEFDRPSYHNPNNPYEMTGAEFDRPRGVAGALGSPEGVPGGGKGYGDMTQFEKDVRASELGSGVKRIVVSDPGGNAPGGSPKLPYGETYTENTHPSHVKGPPYGQTYTENTHPSHVKGPPYGQTYTENTHPSHVKGPPYGETYTENTHPSHVKGPPYGETYTENTHPSHVKGPPYGETYTENSLKMSKGGYGGIGSETENSLKWDMNKDYGGVPRVFSSVEVAKKGDSVWKMVNHQLESRYGTSYAGLSPEKKTYIIDYYKDRVADNPKDFGLKNIDKIKVGQKIDFTRLFEDGGKVKGVFNHAENLDPEQLNNIARNNRSILSWVKAHPGANLTSPKVEEILHHSSVGHGSHAGAGHVDQAVAQHGSRPAITDPSTIRGVRRESILSHVTRRGVNEGPRMENIAADMSLNTRKGFGGAIEAYLKDHGASSAYAHQKALELAGQSSVVQNQPDGSRILSFMDGRTRITLSPDGEKIQSMAESIPRSAGRGAAAAARIIETTGGAKTVGNYVDETIDLAKKGGSAAARKATEISSEIGAGAKKVATDFIGPDDMGRLEELAKNKRIKGTVMIGMAAMVAPISLKLLRNARNNEKALKAIVDQYQYGDGFMAIKGMDKRLAEMAANNSDPKEIGKLKEQREKAFADLYSKISREMFSYDSTTASPSSLGAINAENYLLTSRKANHRFHEIYKKLRKVLKKEAEPKSSETLAQWQKRVVTEFIEVGALAL